MVGMANNELGIVIVGGVSLACTSVHIDNCFKMSNLTAYHRFKSYIWTISWVWNQAQKHVGITQTFSTLLQV